MIRKLMNECDRCDNIPCIEVFPTVFSVAVPLAPNPDEIPQPVTGAVHNWIK